MSTRFQHMLIKILQSNLTYISFFNHPVWPTNKNWSSLGNLEIWHIFWLDGGVISNVTSTWRITCKTTHSYIYICKLVFVWRQCFLNKSSGHREPKAHSQKWRVFGKYPCFAHCWWLFQDDIPNTDTSTSETGEKQNAVSTPTEVSVEEKWTDCFGNHAVHIWSQCSIIQLCWNHKICQTLIWSAAWKHSGHILTVR